MSYYKSVTFNENDKALVDKIILYQKENNLTFVAAVRKLCTDALNVNCVLKNKEM